MRHALDNFVVSGVDTTIPFLRFLLDQLSYTEGDVNTRWVESRLDHFSV
jgi:biotin carboxylase